MCQGLIRHHHHISGVFGGCGKSRIVFGSSCNRGQSKSNHGSSVNLTILNLMLVGRLQTSTVLVSRKELNSFTSTAEHGFFSGPQCDNCNAFRFVCSLNGQRTLGVRPRSTASSQIPPRRLMSVGSLPEAERKSESSLFLGTSTGFLCGCPFGSVVYCQLGVGVFPPAPLYTLGMDTGRGYSAS